MEKTRSVSRCVAVAAHGRRCQQSPFRGSPYCWHHTQSRKVWAPSRPLAAGGPVRLVEDQEIVAPPAPPELTAAEIATAARLFRGLGPERAQALLSFLDGSPGADDFTIVREREREAAQRPPATRLRRQAAG
jgi:hypothetical protein